MTVTGKTVAENLAELARRRSTAGDPRDDRTRCTRPAGWRSCAARSRRTVRWSRRPASTPTVFEGTARVFDTEQPAMDAVTNGDLKAGDVVVIRYEGPRGGPGHARDARGDRRDQGRRPGQGRAAADRRPVLRWDDRAVHRSCRAGGDRRRPDRVRPRRRPDPPRRRRPARSTCWSTTRSSSGARAAGPRRRRATRPACSASTRGWSARPRKAPSAAEPCRSRGSVS